MKTNFQRLVGSAALVASCISFSLATVSVVMITGCGQQNNDADLDRIPNVPPSTRGDDGATAKPGEI